MIKYAPILIPTLNRFEHLKRCVNSLLDCKGVNNTDLFIALDFPLKNSHWEGYKKIQLFIEEIKGFKSVNIIRRERNFGAHNNIFEAYKVIFEKHERVILSEDDNVFSKDFLYFVNSCLEKFKDDASVFSVSGYNYPVKIPSFYEGNVYLWKGFSAWGVGLWREKFCSIDWSEETIRFTTKRFLMDFESVKQWNSISHVYIPALVNMLKKDVIHGDTYVCLYLYLNNMVSVFPVESRVRNLGHDGSGINCGFIEDSIYSTQHLYARDSNYEISGSIIEDPIIYQSLRKHFEYPLIERIKTFIKVILVNLKIY